MLYTYMYVYNYVKKNKFICKTIYIADKLLFNILDKNYFLY